MTATRLIRVTRDDVDMTYTPVACEASITGYDEETGERVTFWLFADAVMDMLNLVADQGQAAVPVSDHQILRVESAGEWDSPGTSPEEGS